MPCGKGAPKRTRERVLKGEATRQAIISRALKIASAQGLAAVTWGRLARDLKMSKSGLFAHFRSKRARELATIDRAREVFAKEVLLPAEQPGRHRKIMESLRSLAEAR